MKKVYEVRMEKYNKGKNQIIVRLDKPGKYRLVEKKVVGVENIEFNNNIVIEITSGTNTEMDTYVFDSSGTKKFYQRKTNFLMMNEPFLVNEIIDLEITFYYYGKIKREVSVEDKLIIYFVFIVEQI